jgi:hypothetical protein
MNKEPNLTAIEAIGEFYRLKDKYESEYHENYVRAIIADKNMSKREKKVAFSRLPKPPCINCNRNVGSLFTITIDDTNKEGFKKYNIKCGDMQEPCPLDIEINYSIRLKMDTLIYKGLKEIDRLKLEIIKEKNNALFFNKSVVDIFEKITQELKIETEDTGFLMETRILRCDNPEEALILKKTIDEFGKGCILPFEEMVKQYNDTNDELILNRAVDFYINEMIPKLKEIQQLKYSINMVEYDEKEKIYKLIQLPNSPEENEQYYKDDDKVVKFVRGIKKQTNKTRKKKETETIKNKTRKVKPILKEIILEEDDEDKKEEGDKEKEGDKEGEKEGDKEDNNIID